MRWRRWSEKWATHPRRARPAGSAAVAAPRVPRVLRAAASSSLVEAAAAPRRPPRAFGGIFPCSAVAVAPKGGLLHGRAVPSVKAALGRLYCLVCRNLTRFGWPLGHQPLVIPRSWPGLPASPCYPIVGGPPGLWLEYRDRTRDLAQLFGSQWARCPALRPYQPV
jgi:hypothetical protein